MLTYWARRAIAFGLAGTVLVPGVPAYAGGGNVPLPRPPCTPRTCEVGVELPGVPGSGGPGTGDGNGGSSSEPSPCTYEMVSPTEGTVGGVGGQPDGPGAWYWKVCSANGVSTSELVRLPSPPVVTPEQLAQRARERITLPSVQVRVNPAGTTLVNLPTWLAMTGGWDPQSATASVPGLSATVTARPTRAVWTVGDGSTVTCTGPGTLYQPGVHHPRAESRTCGYTYRRSSAGMPGEAFRVSVTVSWQVAWSGGGQNGTFDGMTTSGFTLLRVEESQTVIR